MREGEVVQLGKPREIYENPRSKFVAEFIGTSNFIHGTVVTSEDERYSVETTEGRLFLDSSANMPPGTEVVVSIRPECVGLHTERPGDVANLWEGKVTTRAFLGDAVDHVVVVGKHEIRARCAPSVSVEPGSSVFLHLEDDKLSLVPID
jgi:iron(III) transport system ATP-binding protein